MNFKNAIVRTPGSNFSLGLTSANLGAPDYIKALEQHAAYCSALQNCGLNLTILEPDLEYPDSTFVEDTAVLTPGTAILTCPGAASRIGEVAVIQLQLQHFYHRFYQITPPGSLEGGDICQAGSHFFIGLSDRTNEEGTRQLAEFLAKEGYTYSIIDIRDIQGILHLKSGLAYLGDQTLIIIESLKDHPAFKGYQTILMDSEEDYAANCILINDAVLLAKGYPKFKARLEALGFRTIPLDISEIQKMDGGLSCLSLRF